jgi:hypothetical protein
MNKREKRFWRRAIIEAFCAVPVSLKMKDIDAKCFFAEWCQDVNHFIRFA